MVDEQNIDENDEDGNRVSAINRNAVIESGTDGQDGQEEQQTPYEEERKDGFRLD